ncbi:PTS fructose-like transporter subunit IIB [Deinococcus radiodurans]|jgi:PTS system D-fructose-specific IIB component (F1P-forming), Frc family (TC 4.A.2.1.1)/PTS system D-fructose-specific IIC component (F1P-forming), Frc family (TC 4.A.2.1.1)|uniref:PTS system, fructose-specific IIBC component n=1 Tax=Deinococcus radiodurans (strain ATCC 13939 / DSM 20539 / JCM 16871 / CCUG 27074 / LMG 4051 / NBRC 15346 / NCIMB 9279 / VKM B-1422 / R1) TaxID=243230 RepID=Q9RZP7_DEIRA|nr:PTS fructose-like transporter subunit IIB [Deinococcus radiodurans]AAF12595.1 PTS system, fructose-specific IIBC component [Deinococcus radiodurans R1 = ATCC 13939 = DSM 20539]ANC73282.1 PTS fructose transporter subunit IIBC [Deinococcus radiodurans R1 = ATCC 13939 = DSM 20539]QEM73273.1 PTS fructose-like transporter subunit IIB [Deinococcus radiodurans]QIP30664.1 PTS fructose-like transporter subunit IIB [Deinococcus radiodurans]QIP33542.1 PTS fructose-like transporter subunit IIB [Deinoco
MAKLVAVTACPTGIAHTFMAAEALRRAALAAGHDIRVETQGSVGTADALTPSEIAAADAVILATDVRVDEARFAGKPVVQTSTQDAIRNAAGLVAQATAALGAAAPAAAPVSDGKKYIVGITSCPTGIAHTFMAAEGLEGGAKSLGYDVKIETQGSVGAGNALSDDDVRRADVVVIAADTNVDLSRFAGKRVYQTGTKPAIKDGAAVVRTALAEAPVYGSGSAASSGDYVADAAAAKAAKNAGVPSFYKHLMTGVSHMLPFVVAGGLLIALGFAFGSFQFGDQGIFIYEDKYAGTIGNLLFNIGANGAFKLFVPVLAGYIAFSIADRPGLAPGMVGGLIAANTGSGFLGGMVAGFIAGYFVRWLNRALKLPRTLEGLKPTLLLPLLGTLVVGLLMLTVVGKPVAAALTAVTNWLQGLGQGSAGLLGALLGGMMAFDMGGPINKAAYTFSTGLLTNKVYGPIAATMAAGMTPPLALFFATQLFKNRFTKDEQEAGKAAGVLGISFITEGAIPFAARDPLRVIPALMAGSAVAGFISMATGCLLRAPHGGIFVLFIPNAVTNLPMYIVAIVAGTAVSTLLLGLLKKPLAVTPVPSGEGTL